VRLLQHAWGWVCVILKRGNDLLDPDMIFDE